MRHLRAHSEKLLAAVEEGLLCRDQVILACIKYMTEQDVQHMCEANCFFDDEAHDASEADEDEEDPMDNFNHVGSRYHY